MAATRYRRILVIKGERAKGRDSTPWQLSCLLALALSCTHSLHLLMSLVAMEAVPFTGAYMIVSPRRTYMIHLVHRSSTPSVLPRSVRALSYKDTFVLVSAPCSADNRPRRPKNVQVRFQSAGDRCGDVTARPLPLTVSEQQLVQ